MLPRPSGGISRRLLTSILLCVPFLLRMCRPPSPLLPSHRIENRRHVLPSTQCLGRRAGLWCRLYLVVCICCCVLLKRAGPWASALAHSVHPPPPSTRCHSSSNFSAVFDVGQGSGIGWFYIYLCLKRSGVGVRKLNTRWLKNILAQFGGYAVQALADQSTSCGPWSVAGLRKRISGG